MLTTANYGVQYNRISHLASDDMKAFHNYLRAESDGFESWSFVQTLQLEKPLAKHFKAVQKLLDAVQEDKGYSGNKFTGSKYNLTRNLGVAELAKLVREELKIEYPGCKFSVTIDRYSMGQSLDVDIKEVDFDPLSAKLTAFLAAGGTYDGYVKERQSAGYNYEQREYPYFNEAYEKFAKKVKATVEQYNFDDSDSQSDYFHVRFHSSIRDLSVPEYLTHRNDPGRKAALQQQASASRQAEREQAKARKAEKLNRFGSFKKGDWAIWVPGYSNSRKYWEKGDRILCKIRKVPNGQARFSQFTIDIYILKPEYSAAAGFPRESDKKYRFREFEVSPDALKPYTDPAPAAAAKPVRTRAEVTAALGRRRASKLTSQAITAKTDKRRQSHTDSTAKRRTPVRPAPVVTAPAAPAKSAAKTPAKTRATPVAKTRPAAPAKVTRPAATGKARKKPCGTPKQVKAKVERLETRIKNQSKQIQAFKGALRKIHRQTIIS